MTHSKAALVTCLVLLLALGSIVTQSTLADVIVLKSGRRLEGKVKESGDVYSLTQADGSQSVIPKRLVKELIKGPSPAPKPAKPKPRPAPATRPATPPKSKPPAATTKPAKYLTLDLAKGVTMKLVLIPAGKFMMGSSKTQQPRHNEERPQHEVTISKPFYMGVYEVTQEQYEALVGKNPAKFKGANNPVESVSWNDAVAFCKALSKKTGKTVRLPTEAEWEYACRAGTKTAFCFGDDGKQLGDYAWYRDNSGSKSDPLPKPHPVGQKKPNAWGLYDIHGNVFEWCSDWFAYSYANAKAVDPQGPATGKSRVVRGGSWFYGAPDTCRSARRGKYPLAARGHDNCGLRAVVGVD